MEDQSTHESVEPGNLRLRLRDGLTFELHEYSGEPCYVVKNGISSGYYQIGIPEYALVSLLDGRTTLQEAVETIAWRLGEDALTLRDAIGTCHWLVQSGLADPVDEQGATCLNPEHLLDQDQTAKQRKAVSHVNLLFIKLPLGDPTRPLAVAAAAFGWITSRAFLLVWLVVVGVAVFLVSQNGPALAHAAQGLLAANGWLWLLVTFVVMKLVHELGHGIFCLRMGGRVKETGIVFILLMPMPYVDVTSCWGLPSKWQRIAVSAAGMYVELFVAALAAIAWTLTQDAELRFHLFNVALTGSLTTILFNTNFLMRFDGYYMLSDWLEVPNLYQSGQQFLQSLGKRFLLGMNVTPQRFPGGRANVVRAYGIAAFVWRILICVSLSILATALFYGFGVAFALLGVVIWVGVPALALFKLLRSGQVGYGRLVGLTIPASVCLGALLFVLPWPQRVSSPAFVQYQNPGIVRSQTAGFVRGIHVVDGQQVTRGERLIVLENRELETDLTSLEMQRQRLLVRSRGFHQTREIAAYQSEVAKREAIDQQIHELRQKLDSLAVVAEADGVVVAADLDSWTGRYLAQGQEIMRIVDESKKELVVSVAQDDFEEFAGAVSSPAVYLASYGSARCEGTLKVVEPHASTICETRLTSFAGGSLAVKQSANPEADAANGLELLRPRFKGTVSVSSEISETLKAGGTGYVRLDRFSDSIALHWVKAIRFWIRDCVDMRNATLAAG